MYVVIVKMKPWPAKRKELLQTLSSIVEMTRNEEGNMECGVYHSVEDENNLLLMEQWATRQSSEAHLNSDIFTVLRGAGSLMSRPPEISRHVAKQ